MAESSGVLSATQEACQAELELAEAMCATSSSSAEASAAAAASEELGGQPGRQLQEADWQEVVYKVSRVCIVDRPAVQLLVKQWPMNQLAK